MTHWAELEVLLAARHYGIGMVPWGPPKGGVLGGALRKRKEGTAVRGAPRPSAGTLAERHNVIAGYESWCEGIGEKGRSLSRIG